MALVVALPGILPCKVVDWKVKAGSRITQATILALYKPTESDNVQKLKCNYVGTVIEVVVPEGQTVEPGSVVLKLEGCQHPTVMKDMCAECGADLREEHGIAGDRKSSTSATVAMVHSIPELIVSEELALEIGRQDERRLLNHRKLVLLVDLDQTLLHTTNDNIPANLKDVDHFRLWHGKWMWYHTKFRPNYRDFLDKMSKYYELHICTFGVRLYAHTIARFLDPEGKYFSHRILSRDECFSANSKTANLKALFPCGDSMVCIIDDRDDVWKFAPNLVHVKPYLFFDGTADINAPPGLATKSKDENVKPPRHNVKVVRIPRKRSPTMENHGAEVKVTEINQLNTNKNGAEAVESIDADDGKIQSDSVTKDDVITGEEGPNMDSQGSLAQEASKDTETVMDTEQASDNSTCDSTGFPCIVPMLSEDDQSSPNKDHKDISEEDKPQTEVTSVDFCSTNSNNNKAMEPAAAPVTKSVVVEESADNNSPQQVNSSEKSSQMIENTKDTPQESCPVAAEALVNSSETSLKEENSSGSTQQVAGTSEPAACDDGSVTVVTAEPSGLEDLEVSDDSSDSEDSNESSNSQSDKEVIQAIEPSEDKNTSKTPDKDNNITSAASSTAEAAAPGKSSPPDGATGTPVPSEKEDGEVTSEEDREAAEAQRPGILPAQGEEYDEMVEWEDTDDYLHYLEDILTRIHKAYYEMYDQSKDTKSSKIPDLKSIIPYVKKKVLQGANVLFSGVIPTNQLPEKSRAYNLARSFGAGVHSVFVPRTESNKSEATTHIVAAKTGTAKVHQARKHKTVKIVNPDWLWTCCQRWEWVDERLFPLTDQSSYPYADSPEPRKQHKKSKGKKITQVKIESNNKAPKTTVSDDQTASNDTARSEVPKAVEKRERRFSDSYNPLFAFSSSDIKEMDKEVEEIFDESESEDSEAELRRVVLGYNKKRPRESSSEEESLTGEYPKGWGKKRSKCNKGGGCDNTDNNLTDEDLDDENEEMRKIIENPTKLIKLSDQSSESRSSFNESIGSVDEEMAAALEKEFLSCL